MSGSGTGTPISTGSPELDRWDYKYDLPIDLLYVRRVTDENDYDKNGYPYEMFTEDGGTPVLFTNIEDAYLVYTSDLTDATRFTEGMIDVLVYMLAIKLARAIVGAKAGTIVRELRDTLRNEIGPQARAADGLNTYVDRARGTTAWTDAVLSRPIFYQE